MQQKAGLKVALVADWLTNQGGAEQVVAALSDLFPQAPIYTSVYTPGAVPALDEKNIRGTWLQRLPAKLRQKHQFLLPFLPGAFAKLDLSEFDVIISSSSAFAKCVRKTRAHQIHICYCHTPTRYLYHAREEYLNTYPLPFWLAPFKIFLPWLLDHLTRQDLAAAKAVDYFIANSNYVAERIKKYYGREATTVYPCVAIEKFDRPLEEFKASGDPRLRVGKPVEPIDLDPRLRGDNFDQPLASRAGSRGLSYFLAVGRFIPYKKFDLLVRTFAHNGLPLKLAGVGPELERCKTLAKELQANNIEFLEFVPYKALPNLYAQARAFVFPAEEDFGLTPVEAMAAGVPVIAYGQGGATESVTSETGVFFAEQTPRSLQEALDNFISIEQKFSSKKITQHAQKFGIKTFQQQIQRFVDLHGNT